MIGFFLPVWVIMVIDELEGNSVLRSQKIIKIGLWTFDQAIECLDSVKSADALSNDSTLSKFD